MNIIKMRSVCNKLSMEPTEPFMSNEICPVGDGL